MGVSYQEFLEHKMQLGGDHGFDPSSLPDFLFDFQRALVAFALRKGRSAIFADCGLGKTPCQLAWADEIVKRENKSVLILTPLAVSHQTVRQADKFDIEARRSSGELEPGAHIVVTNYERLHHFSPGHFAGVVADESSILKNFDGKRKAEVTEFMRRVPYRLLATATAAPNDYIELGTSSEALGEMGYMDMLGRFFRNEQNTCDTRDQRMRAAFRHGVSARVMDRQRWRFKGHAEQPFWRWVCSWSRAMRKPSDLGFEDGRFDLPPLVEREHVVEARTLADGMLFSMPAVGLREEREERRRTLQERCEMVAQLVEHDKQAIVWCHLNDEGSLLTELIVGAEEVAGKHSDDEKEKKLHAFADGKLRVLVIKPKIGAWGLNLENCSHVVTFASHSFEQYYQSVRRCWRFGQTKPVIVDLVATEGERGIRENLRRKQAAADRMFTELVKNMNDALRLARGQSFTTETECPAWL